MMIPMKPQRYDDQSDLNRPLSLRDAMSRLFDESIWDPFEDRGLMSERVQFPKVDVSETESEVKVTANVPGMKAEDLSIEADEDSLYLSGVIQQENEQKDEKQYRYEREYGEFSREIFLPARIDPDKIEASTKDGVLTVTMPKVEEGSGRKKISVKQAS